MRRRHPNPTLAKQHRCYTIAEISNLYGVHKNTVGNWLRAGLTPIDSRRPVMVAGTELNSFHSRRKLRAKRPCGPGELYCVPCQKPQRPAGDMAEYTALTDKIGMLRAICPDCERMLFQRVNETRLATFRALIDVMDAKG